MNELQQCEFEILKEVIRVCEKLDIKYFLVCGSALGAVKYEGFIPWDDDIDVGMFRSDYDRFLKCAQEMLPEHLFVQNYHTDPQYPQLFTKIRNSNTTYIEKASANLSINHGVYIDIFPLDGYPKEEIEQEKIEKKKRYYKFLSECSCDFERSHKAELVTNALRLFQIQKRNRKVLTKYEEMISKYRIEDSEIICNHGNWQGRREYAAKEQYGEGAFATFEGLKVRIPEKYDEYFTQKYGDWRSDLPKEQKVGHHYYKIFDMNKSYLDYKI